MAAKKRIMIAEDEVELVKALRIRLEAEGYNCLAAYDGKEALETARREKPDLIILDLMLPKMDGYKVCGLLKKDTRYNKIPIIMFTAKAQKEDMEMGKELGAEAYITKPFDPQILLAKIKELLEKL